MKIHKKLCSIIIKWFKDFIALIEMFNREKKEIPNKEIVKENKKDRYEYVYDYLEKEVLNKNEDEEDISNEARRFIKNLEAAKERRYRRGSL